MNSLGLIAKKGSDYHQALECYRLAMELLPHTEEVAKMLEVRYNLADVYRKLERWDDAKELYVSTLAQLEARYGASHPEVAEVCNSLGMLEKKLNNYTVALKHYKRALKIVEHFFGKQHPKVGMYQTNIGDIYRCELPSSCEHVCWGGVQILLTAICCF